MSVECRFGHPDHEAHDARSGPVRRCRRSRLAGLRRGGTSARRSRGVSWPRTPTDWRAAWSCAISETTGGSCCRPTVPTSRGSGAGMDRPRRQRPIAGHRRRAPRRLSGPGAGTDDRPADGQAGQLSGIDVFCMSGTLARRTSEFRLSRRPGRTPGRPHGARSFRAGRARVDARRAGPCPSAAGRMARPSAASSSRPRPSGRRSRTARANDGARRRAIDGRGAQTAPPSQRP